MGDALRKRVFTFSQNGRSRSPEYAKRRERMHVTRYQAKAALLEAGLLDQCESIVEASNDPQLAIAWQEAGFIRQSAFVDYVGGQLGLTSQQLDDLFIAAAKIK